MIFLPPCWARVSSLSTSQIKDHRVPSVSSQSAHVLFQDERNKNLLFCLTNQATQPQQKDNHTSTKLFNKNTESRLGRLFFEITSGLFPMRHCRLRKCTHSRSTKCCVFLDNKRGVKRRSNRDAWRYCLQD